METRDKTMTDITTTRPYSGPYFCCRCGKKLSSDAPFETDDGSHGTVVNTAWGYCSHCKEWTEYPPVTENA